MSALSAFLNPTVTTEEKELIVSKRFLDEKGKPAPFRIRSLTQEENSACSKAATRNIKVNGGYQEKVKTEFVPSFAFSAATYPGSTDPKLDGKPVMVLAVKGENPDSCTYSFLSMAALVDTYKAKAVGKDTSTTVSIAGYEVDVKVNVSAAEGNALTLKEDGLYVSTANVEASDTNGNIKVNGKEVTVYTEPANVLHSEDVEDFSAEDIAAMLAD